MATHPLGYGYGYGQMEQTIVHPITAAAAAFCDIRRVRVRAGDARGRVGGGTKRDRPQRKGRDVVMERSEKVGPILVPVARLLSKHGRREPLVVQAPLAVEPDELDGVVLRRDGTSAARFVRAKRRGGGRVDLFGRIFHIHILVTGQRKVAQVARICESGLARLHRAIEA